MTGIKEVKKTRIHNWWAFKFSIEEGKEIRELIKKVKVDTDPHPEEETATIIGHETARTRAAREKSIFFS